MTACGGPQPVDPNPPVAGDVVSEEPPETLRDPLEACRMSSELVWPDTALLAALAAGDALAADAALSAVVDAAGPHLVAPFEAARAPAVDDEEAEPPPVASAPLREALETWVLVERPLFDVGQERFVVAAETALPVVALLADQGRVDAAERWLEAAGRGRDDVNRCAAAIDDLERTSDRSSAP